MKRWAITILLAVIVMAAACLARLPSAALPSLTPERREALTDAEGRLYLTDPDSYYHVRLVNNELANGQFGDAHLEDGADWDTLSYAPEGRSAEYQPGLIRLTAGAWRALNALFGVSLYDVEFCLPVVLSALTALAAFVFGCRVGGKTGGLTAGLLVGCAPAFTTRTVFGRFDTDAFVLLMDVLLILFLTEAFRARTRRARLLFSAGFALTAALYSRCWTPEGAAVIAGAALAGGLLYVLALTAAPRSFLRGRRYEKREPITWLLCAALTACILTALHGTALWSSALAYRAATAPIAADGGVLPNLLVGIIELSVPRLLPETVAQWFTGRGDTTIVGGVGGAMAALACLGGLIWCAAQCFRRNRRPDVRLARRSHLMLFCLFAALLAAGLFACRYGRRFIEHLAAPVGLSAGALIGGIAESAGVKSGLRRAALACALLMAAVIPAGRCAYLNAGESRPCASDASAKAMAWVRENAQDPRAMILSWWDLGYYYESESGHPCLWDGATQDGARGILLSKALATGDAALSRAILRMLAVHGNRGIDYLMARADAKTAFQALFEALPQDREASAQILTERCGLSPEEARTADALIHPAENREAYLVLTHSMLNRIGWFEYYSVWDFTGKAAPPATTLYRFTPDGQSITDSEFGQQYFKVRSQSVFWRLFREGAAVAGFRPVFSTGDSVETVRVFRIE